MNGHHLAGTASRSQVEGGESLLESWAGSWAGGNFVATVRTYLRLTTAQTAGSVRKFRFRSLPSSCEVRAPNLSSTSTGLVTNALATVAVLPNAIFGQ